MYTFQVSNYDKNDNLEIGHFLFEMKSLLSLDIMFAFFIANSLILMVGKWMLLLPFLVLTGMLTLAWIGWYNAGYLD